MSIQHRNTPYSGEIVRLFLADAPWDEWRDQEVILVVLAEVPAFVGAALATAAYVATAAIFLFLWRDEWWFMPCLFGFIGCLKVVFQVARFLTHMVIWCMWLPVFMVVAALADAGVYTSSVASSTAQRAVSALASLDPVETKRLAQLLAFLLPKGIRIDAFNPSFAEDHEDFLDYRKRYRSRGARAFLNACFILKIILLYLDCLRVWFLDKLVWLIPPTIRMLWRRP